jgi:hypothetical protein
MLDVAVLLTIGISYDSAFEVVRLKRGKEITIDRESETPELINADVIEESEAHATAIIAVPPTRQRGVASLVARFDP